MESSPETPELSSTPARTPRSSRPAPSQKRTTTPKATTGTPAKTTKAVKSTEAAKTTKSVKTAAPSTTARKAKAPKKEPVPLPPVVLEVEQLQKRFGRSTAVNGVSLTVRRGSIFGFVGPNGAGKTTTLSMMAGLLRPDSGRVRVRGVDVWSDPMKGKSLIGVLPDRMRLFDRLSGAQMLYYSAVLHGLDRSSALSRVADLGAVLGLDDSLDRPVRDYSVGMIKKTSLAAALIHSPAVLILDEPFESVDPVSTGQEIDLLRRYASAGGTVILSSHNMDLVERVCDSVAVIVDGTILANGTIDEVRNGRSLEARFVGLAGGRAAVEGLEWLTTFSD